ncbi:MAG: hypothetical protein PUC73_12410 [Lachnospiraceae bacterium]|nr:hypothetical protein [Lachnospiraceae bacterium]
MKKPLKEYEIEYPIEETMNNYYGNCESCNSCNEHSWCLMNNYAKGTK